MSKFIIWGSFLLLIFVRLHFYSLYYHDIFLVVPLLSNATNCLVKLCPLGCKLNDNLHKYFRPLLNIGAWFQWLFWIRAMINVRTDQHNASSHAQQHWTKEKNVFKYQIVGRWIYGCLVNIVLNCLLLMRKCLLSQIPSWEIYYFY